MSTDGERKQPVGNLNAGSGDETLVVCDQEKQAPPPTAPPAPQLVTGVKLWLMIVGTYLACFLMLLDTSVVSTAIPQITNEFNSLPDIGWYGSAYHLGCAAVAPLTGKIYRHFSLKWSFITLFALFEVGSAICGAAQSSKMLIVGRAVAGIGAASLLNGSITIVSCAAPPAKRPILIGSMMAVAQLGSVAGPLVGGAFTSGYTWRWSFYINLPLGVIVGLPLVLLDIPDQVPKQSVWKVLPRIHHHLDLLGFALFAPAVIQLLLALQYGGNEYPWRSSVVIGLFCGSGATLIVWMFWNWHKGDDALLPFSMLKRRTIWSSSINYSCLMTTLFGASYFLPIYFQAVKGVSAVLSGVYLLPTIISQLVTTLASGKLVTKVGYVPPFALYAAALAAVGSGLYSLFQPGTTTGQWIGFQILTGAGRGAGFQMPVIAVQNAVSFAEISTAMAFVVWSQYIGPAVFLSIFNTIFQTGLRSQLPEQAPHTNASAVIEAGASAFRPLVPQEDLDGVLVAYSNSLDHVFYLIAALGCVAFFAAFGMGWKDIRQKPAPPKPKEEPSSPASKDGEPAKQ